MNKTFFYIAIMCYNSMFAQKAKVCYAYRYSYSDTSVTKKLSLKTYYDVNGKIKYEIICEFEPADSGWTNYTYDSYGNEIKVLSYDSDTSDSTVKKYEYQYDEQGNIVKCKSIGDKNEPFKLKVELYAKKFYIQYQYDNVEDELTERFANKLVHELNKNGLTMKSYVINSKKDTINMSKNIYFNIKERAKYKNNFELLRNYESITYLNSFGKEVVTDCYHHLKYVGSHITKYDKQKRIVFEGYFEKIKNKFTKATQNFYDKHNKITKKIEESFNEGWKKVHTYKNGFPLRFDFYSLGKLSHSIIYECMDIEE